MYGTLWARNLDNIKELDRIRRRMNGVYVLCDGSMPVYIGRGRIATRVLDHKRSRTRGKYWDHFTWYMLRSESAAVEVEALLLRMLPFYLRSLNKQRGNFLKAKRKKQRNAHPDPIKRAKFGVQRARR